MILSRTTMTKSSPTVTTTRRRTLRRSTSHSSSLGGSVASLVVLTMALAVLLSTSSSTVAVAAAAATEEKSSGTPDTATTSANAPAFFLQDATDGLCLAGEEFRRCTIDTLFYVSGSPGSYQIHKRPRMPSESPEGETATTTTSSSDEDDDCLTLKNCLPKEELTKDTTKHHEVKVAKCTHCGSKQWNILGDANTGYVLSAEDGAVCLVRDTSGKDKNRAVLVDCNNEETPYTPLQLQFVTKSDIEAMSSNAAMLIAHAAAGEKKQVQQLLKDGVDVNSRDWDQLTPLIPAAENGHLDIVKLLIKEGADVNAHEKDQVTALMEAAVRGHTKIVDHLLSSGAEIDATAASGVTALWLAASDGKTDVVKLLLKKNADPDALRVDGIAPIHTAAVGGHADSVKALLDAGADVTVVDKDGLTAIHNAAESGDVPTLKLLVEATAKVEAAKGDTDDEPAIDRLSGTGYTALIIASAHGMTDAVNYLLGQKAEIDKKTPDTGVTALMYAAAHGRLDAMRSLIEAGADINLQHDNKGNALMEACAGNSTESIQLLLEKGTDWMTIDDDGVSPLMSTASQGNFEVVKLLLEKMAGSGMSEEDMKKHINLASKSGGTSVMFSAASGAYEVTKLLIEKGADITLHAQATPDYLEKLAKAIEEGTVDEEEMDPHVDGVTALHVAAQGGHQTCCELLLEHGASVSAIDDEDRTPLLLAVKGNFGEIATLLIEKGSDPNTVYVDDEGVSHNLLMDAIIVENVEFANLLISSGADLYSVDETNVSTLLQASHRGLDEVVKTLLENHKAGGDDGSVQAKYLDHPSDEGITPLVAAASEGHLDVLRLLIGAKANVDTKDKDGTSALMAAAARGHLEAVAALLDAGANIDEQNNDGHTALMFAYNGKNQVETLWERYAQFVSDSTEEDVDDKGTGPVIKEALDNHTKLVNTLLDRGADTKLKDKEGHTAADFDYHPDLDNEVVEKEMLKEKLRDQSKNEL